METRFFIIFRKTHLFCVANIVSSGIAKAQIENTTLPNTHVFTVEIMQLLHSSIQSVQGLQQQSMSQHSQSTLSLETFVGPAQQSLLQSFKHPADASQQLQQSLQPSMAS
jgi:hypothetical protein